MFELTLGQVIFLYLQFFWEKYGLIAVGLGLIVWAHRKKAQGRAKSPLWYGALVLGLCLGLAGGVKLVRPRVEQAYVNRGKTLEVLDDAKERFTLDGVTYQYLHLYNLIWPAPKGTSVYLDPEGWMDLYQVPSGPGLDLLSLGVHLYCPEDQVDVALAWYSDWDNFDIYIGDPAYQEGNLYNAVAQVASPRPENEILTALTEFFDLAEEEKEHHEASIIRGPREGSAVEIEVWPEIEWENQQLYYRSHDGLVAIEGPTLYKMDGRLCIYAFDDWGSKNNIVIPLSEDLAAHFLACWPAAR